MEYRSLSVTLLQIVLLHCGQTQDGSGSTKNIGTSWSEKPNLTMRVDPQSSADTGDTVTLICEESTGWTFLWHKVSQLLHPQNPVENETINLTVSDEGTAKFICAAYRGGYSTQTSDPAKRTVKVLIVLHCGQTQHESESKETKDSGTPGLEEHEQTKREEHQSSLCTGDTVTLTCEVESAGWQLLWYIGSQQLQPLNTADKDSNTVSVTVSYEETAEFKCEARRGDYSTRLSDPAKITIEVTPKL
ncbi:hypothetical protein AOLI_G00106310 [Acnodon oligacanthus]